MDELVRKVYDTIKKSEMICQGDSVIVGVSGGADSVCLLSVLKNLQMSMDLKLTAVHIHHGLRGEAADRDRDFVIQLCQTLHVPCECFRQTSGKWHRHSICLRRKPAECSDMNALNRCGSRSRHQRLQWRIIWMIRRRLCCSICSGAAD